MWCADLAVLSQDCSFNLKFKSVGRIYLYSTNGKYGRRRNGPGTRPGVQRSGGSLSEADRWAEPVHAQAVHPLSRRRPLAGETVDPHALHSGLGQAPQQAQFGT